MALPQLDEGEVISLNELSRRTHLSRPHLVRLRDAGMPVYKIGKRANLVILSEWWDWFRAHRVHGKPS